MNTKNLASLSTALLMVMISTANLAAPLPNGTVLTIDPGTLTYVNGSATWTCTGSCFSLEVVPGVVYWREAVRPGTDGGIVIGKNQQSGGQETGSSHTITTSGEATNTWFVDLQYGTFATAPLSGSSGNYGTATTDASLNKFDDASCAGASCLGKTELGTWHWAWNGAAVALGSAGGCTASTCTPDQLAGILVSNWTVNPDGSYSLDYGNVFPANYPFAGVPFKMHLTGKIVTSGTVWPMASFSFSPLAPRAGEPIQLTDQSMALPGNTIVGWKWTSGFDTLSTLQNPTLRYSYPGNYNVVLIVTDSNGNVSAPTQHTIPVLPPIIQVSDLSISGESGAAIAWKPVISVGSVPLTCSIYNQPTNGAAWVYSDCSSGGYQSSTGFIGTDSFTYLAHSGQTNSNLGVVSVAVTEPTPSSACTGQYPISQFSQTGKAGTLSITFTGNITSHTNKEVKVCPGTTLSYQSTSTHGPVICKVKNSTTRGSGSLQINNHLKCTDKPAGQDKVHFKVKSGVK